MCVLHFDFRGDLMNTKIAFKELMKNFWYYFIALCYSFKKNRFICMITHLKQIDMYLMTFNMYNFHLHAFFKIPEPVQKTKHQFFK